MKPIGISLPDSWGKWEASGGELAVQEADANAWAESMAADAEPREVLDRSEPIIIQLQNTGTNTYNNVQLFGANASYVGTAPYFQNPIAPPLGQNLAITSNIQGVSYTEMLANSQSKPYKVGETMIVSSFPGQSEQTVAVKHKTDTGKVVQYTITPVQDPYQQLKDRTISNYEYMIDGFTTLTLNQLLADKSGTGATVTIYMYLKKRYSPTQHVSGSNPDLEYFSPRIMRFIK